MQSIDLWKIAKQYSDKLDVLLLPITSIYIDKVRVAMFVTWLWALVGLYVTKAFEEFFKVLMKMPDKWLFNNGPPKVKILGASDGKRDITNKLRLFLKYYWESDDGDITFSFNDLNRLLNCSILYCSYLLTDASGDIAPENFWKNVNRFLIEMKDGRCTQYNTQDLSNGHQLPFNTVRFNNKRKPVKARISPELAELLAESVQQKIDSFEALSNS
jgi:hypothetical protein